MKLHEIIAANENTSEGQQNSILIELLLPYRRSLRTYYKDLFCCEPVLIVTSVSNAAQYGFIAPVNEMTEAICDYLDDYNCQDESSENFAEYETICFNSDML